MSVKQQAAFVDNLGRVIRITGLTAQNGTTTTTVNFEHGNSDNNYHVSLDCSWDGAARVSSKNNSSFVVAHSDPGANLEFSAVVFLA
jgi:hypothetical protein